MHRSTNVRGLIAATFVTASLLAGGLVAAPAMADAQPVGHDYASNGTFEDGTITGWSGGTATTTDAHSGSYSMTATGVLGITDSPNAIDGTTATGLDWVRADFWIKGTPGEKVVSTIRQYSPAGDTFLADTITMDGNWDHLVGRPVANAQDGASVDLRIHDDTAPPTAQFFVDDVHVYGGSYGGQVHCGRHYVGANPGQDSIENCGFEAPYGLLYWNNGSDGSRSTLSLAPGASDLLGGGSQVAQLTANTPGTITLNDAPDSRSSTRASSLPANLTTCTASASVYLPPQNHGQVKIRLREFSATGALVSSDVSGVDVRPSGNVWGVYNVTHVLAPSHAGDSLDLNVYVTNEQTGDSASFDEIHETCS
jgi:hypothetical protein